MKSMLNAGFGLVALAGVSAAQAEPVAEGDVRIGQASEATDHYPSEFKVSGDKIIVPVTLAQVGYAVSYTKPQQLIAVYRPKADIEDGSCVEIPFPKKENRKIDLGVFTVEATLTRKQSEEINKVGCVMARTPENFQIIAPVVK